MTSRALVRFAVADVSGVDLCRSALHRVSTRSLSGSSSFKPRSFCGLMSTRRPYSDSESTAAEVAMQPPRWGMAKVPSVFRRSAAPRRCAAGNATAYAFRRPTLPELSLALLERLHQVLAEPGLPSVCPGVHRLSLPSEMLAVSPHDVRDGQLAMS